jgi:putative PIN family toxin of toxin-antitoxin system
MIAYMQSATDAQIVVLDTNVLVAAMRGAGAANKLLSACLEGRVIPAIGAALLAEYEDVVRREAVFRGGLLNLRERDELLEIFLSVCRWTRIYYAWRPNLRDESDNHLIELAVASMARYLVTQNLRDFRNMELKFPFIEIVTATQIVKRLP